VVSASEDGDLRVWRPESGETLRVVPSGHSEVTALAEIPGYPSWLASGGSDGSVLLHDLLVSDRAPVKWDKHPHDKAVRALAVVVGTSSMTIVSAHADGTVRFQDATSPASRAGDVSSHAAHGGETRTLAAGTAGGRAVVFSGGDDHLIKVWDVEHKAQTQTPHRRWVRALAVAELGLDKDGAAEWAVVSGGDDDTIQIRDLAGKRRGRVLSAHHRGVRALAVPDGDEPVLISGGVDHRLGCGTCRERMRGPLTVMAIGFAHSTSEPYREARESSCRPAATVTCVSGTSVRCACSCRRTGRTPKVA
jgi:WD40 repeat protein